MKKIGLLIVVIISLISCSNDDENVTPSLNSEYFGKWIMIPGPAENSIPGYEIYYQFSEDKTFVKTIPSTSGKASVSGKYEIVKNDSETSLVLTYSATNEWISTCTTGALQEILVLNKSGILVYESAKCGRYGMFRKIK